MNGRAEQLKGKDEKAVGNVTESDETQARGTVHEARGKAREKVADVRAEVKKAVDEPGEKVAEIKGEVQRGMDEAGQKIAEMKGGVQKWLDHPKEKRPPSGRAQPRRPSRRLPP